MKEPLKQSNNEFFGQIHPPLSEAPAKLSLQHLPPGAYRVTVHRTGFQKNDPYTRYLELGSPKQLSPAQVNDLKSLASDKPESEETIAIGADGQFERSFPLRTNDICLVRLTPVNPVSP